MRELPVPELVASMEPPCEHGGVPLLTPSYTLGRPSFNGAAV